MDNTFNAFGNRWDTGTEEWFCSAGHEVGVDGDQFCEECDAEIDPFDPEHLDPIPHYAEVPGGLRISPWHARYLAGNADMSVFVPPFEGPSPF